MFIEFIFCLIVFILGCCIGSFLNCFIYRLEEGKTLKGRSFCPNCKHTLNWQDLFPVFSYLFLNGKCRYCHKKISIQYPLVELLTGIVFVVAFWSLGINLLFGIGLGDLVKICFLFYVSASLIIIFIYDLKHYIIPDRVLFPAIIITLIYDLATPNQILYKLLAVLVASGFFLSIFLVSKGKWMGFGDVKLAILMGLLLGLSNVLVALFLAFLFGAIIGIILMVFEKKGLKSEIPFGPFLIAGTFLALFYGEQLINWYFKLFLS